MSRKELEQILLSGGATGVGEIAVKDIQINEHFRTLCENNACGRYGRNYMCPPSIGDMDFCKSRVQSYEKAFAIQLIHDVEDSYDYEGMMAGQEKHRHLMLAARDWFSQNGYADSLTLGGGSCHICEVCGIVTGEPCRKPGETISSVEGYGLDVTELARLAGMPFKWGEPRVYYVGVVLFND